MPQKLDADGGPDACIAAGIGGREILERSSVLGTRGGDGGSTDAIHERCLEPAQVLPVALPAGRPGVTRSGRRGPTGAA